jgi:hypothetical protein
MLGALMGGTALTATELAASAEVTASTASSHLAKLAGAGVVTVARQGRHRYFVLADYEIADVLERLMGAASRQAPRRRTGPADLELRAARVCYDHLAGEKGVWLFAVLTGRGILCGQDSYVLSPAGRTFLERFGIDVDLLSRARRPLCHVCLDWSERRFHLAGALGAALLGRILALGWAERDTGSRVVRFSAGGERAFRARFENAP